MKKILTLFHRNYGGDRLVRDEVVPGTEWVIAGEGAATRKFDGTCCMVRDGKLYRRYDANRGKQPRDGFEPSQDYDEVTGHWPGWLPVGGGPEDRWHREAWQIGGYCDGTYELCGPKVQGNPEGFQGHVLVLHGAELLAGNPRSFEQCKAYFSEIPAIEGIVWHHPDGPMAKIKAKDFGFKRAIRIPKPGPGP